MFSLVRRDSNNLGKCTSGFTSLDSYIMLHRSNLWEVLGHLLSFSSLQNSKKQGRTRTCFYFLHQVSDYTEIFGNWLHKLNYGESLNHQGSSQYKMHLWHHPALELEFETCMNELVCIVHGVWWLSLIIICVLIIHRNFLRNSDISLLFYILCVFERCVLYCERCVFKLSSQGQEI